MSMAPALLDIPSIRERALPLTVAQYHALGAQSLIPEQVELLDGLIVEKMSKLLPAKAGRFEED